MGCCGQKRAQVTGTGAIGKNPAGGATSASKFVLYEYDGPTGMNVIGAVSGLGYRFAAPGAKVLVDPRDAAAMAALPHLRRLA